MIQNQYFFRRWWKLDLRMIVLRIILCRRNLGGLRLVYLLYEGGVGDHKVVTIEFCCFVRLVGQFSLLAR